MTPATGEIIEGKYRIVRLLGQGGMGSVYEGENLRIRRRVAIKLLHENVSSNAESVARFEKEAEAAGRIGSDHICEVLDLGVLPDATRYMVMEYLDGETLGARIERMGRMGPDLTVPIMLQVLDALGAAHTARIIHRDLKPDNIFILPTKAGLKDFVKVLDFGVSKFSPLSGEEMSMTRTGAVVGTPYYMSPEQARGAGPVDQRTDIYAMGVLLYQATTGHVPFDANTFNELLFKIVLEPAPPPQQFVPDLDPDFAAIIQKAMARELAQRFQSCVEFKNALLNWVAARPGLTSLPNRPTFSRLPPVAAQTQQLDVSTPQPQMRGSGSQWANASSPPGAVHGVTGPQRLTANSWADASSATGQTAKPPSKAPILVALAATATLLAAGVGGWLVFGRSGTPSAPIAETSSASATAVPAAPPPEPPRTAEPVVVAAPTATEPATSAKADPTAEASTARVTAPPLRPQPRVFTNPGRPAPPTPAKPTPAPPVTKPAVPGDFGY